MIQFQYIGKSFDGKVVLDDVNGSFMPGKVSLVIGASGIGKSVFLRCLVGLTRPDTGMVSFDGRDLWSSSPRGRMSIQRETGMLFQGGALFDSKTVEENVRFPLDVFTSMSVREKKERVDFFLERVGLVGVHKKMPSELSGGMKKRVGIARAIVTRPKYLLCDEPNAGLDPNTGQVIDLLIKELTEEYGVTTVVVTHDMNTVVSIGDAILLLDEGKKVWEGDLDAVWSSRNKALENFLFGNQLMQIAKRRVNKK